MPSDEKRQVTSLLVDLFSFINYIGARDVLPEIENAHAPILQTLLTGETARPRAIGFADTSKGKNE